MRTGRNQSSMVTFVDTIVAESQRYGNLVTLLVMGALSFGVGYLIYSYVLSGWSESNATYAATVRQKESDITKTEKLLAEEEQFKGKLTKVVELYQEAKPLLPEETEISDVLGQVEAAAQRNGVTLTGLMAVKESVKSPRAEKLYEREIPALVTGSYPQVVRFLTDISRMPRILVVRDYSIVSMKSGVSAGFTLVAFHAPPPAEKPNLQPNLATGAPNQPAANPNAPQPEVKKQ